MYKKFKVVPLVILALVLFFLVAVVIFLMRINRPSPWFASHSDGTEVVISQKKDIESLQQIIAQCRKTPAGNDLIEKYLQSEEWQGYTFSYSGTSNTTSYIFNTRMGIMIVRSVTEEPAYYVCTEDTLQQVEEIYEKYN